MRKLIVMAAAGVLLAAPAHAQSHQHGASQATAAKEHECPMHQAGTTHGSDAAHRYMPKMVLQHADMLKLTTDQVAALEKIQTAHKAECEQHMAGMKSADDAAAALLEQETVDLAQYEARLRESADLKVRCRLGMVAAGQQAKALLTAEQLTHLSHTSHTSH